jgi:hypothetical protein
MTASAEIENETLSVREDRASYAAAKRGDIPTIKIGRLLRVPVAAFEDMLRVLPSRKNEAKAMTRPQMRSPVTGQGDRAISQKSIKSSSDNMQTPLDLQAGNLQLLYLAHATAATVAIAFNAEASR